MYLFEPINRQHLFHAIDLVAPAVPGRMVIEIKHSTEIGA